MKYVSDITDGIGEVKRLYCELNITSECPTCHKEVHYDLSERYVSYGELTLYYECEDCDDEWEIETDVTATVTIETKE